MKYSVQTDTRAWVWVSRHLPSGSQALCGITGNGGGSMFKAARPENDWKSVSLLSHGACSTGGSERESTR
jgi:hypothetical protein